MKLYVPNYTEVLRRVHTLHRTLRHITRLPQSDIQHIGSTAVRGCVTKGDIDFVIRVRKSQFSTVKERLSKHFEINSGSVVTDTFTSFTVDDMTGVQLTAKGAEYDIFTEFTRILRNRKIRVLQYNRLKRAAKDMPEDTYRARKDEFIGNILRKGA